MRRSILSIVCTALFVFAAGGAHANMVPITTIHPTDGDVVSSGFTRGYQFEVFSNVTITALGVYDLGADGWTGEPTTFVGLWNEAQTLLASVEVAPTDALHPTVYTLNGFNSQVRYVVLGTPLVLSPGKYRVAANLADIDEPADYFHGATPTGSLAEVGNYAAVAKLSPGEGFPDNLGASGFAHLGGTVLLQPAKVPAASAVWLGALGLLIVSIVALRRWAVRA